MSKIVKQILRYKKGITLLSVGKIIPRDWQYVEIEKLEEKENEIILKLRKIVI